MGINGLTTYLRTHRQTLSKTIELQSTPGPGDEGDSETRPNIDIVVDGWSFIYIVYQSSKIPWVYGGEYDYFSQVIQSTLTTWMDMGVNLSFVFDGPHETPKFPTIVSRLTNSTVHHGALFFRTSRTTRSTQRFLNETRIIPPLVYAACVESVLKLSSRFQAELSDQPNGSTSIRFPSAQTSVHPKASLSVYFADREADPFMVELAGHLGAYVAALDSDFVVLNSPGYAGYIPLDELEWVYEVPQDMDTTRSRTTSSFSISSSVASLLSPSEISADAGAWDGVSQIEDTGFTVVKKKRSRTISAKAMLNAAKVRDGMSTQRSLIPPANSTGLKFFVYTPDSTATSLKLPTALLPLLGAFVGNDYTPTRNLGPPISSSFPRYTHREFLYEHKMNSGDRITYTANILSAVLQGLTKSGRKKIKAKPLGILDVIRVTVQQMLLRPSHTTDREIDAIVNRIVEGALVYAIPPPPTRDPNNPPPLWPTPFCPIHTELELCRLDALYPEKDDEESHGPQQLSPAAHRHSFVTGEPTDPVSMVQRQYLRAYREGSLDPSVLDVLVTGTMWPRTFLENPDVASAAGPSEAGGSLRKWLYAILDQGIGVYAPPVEEEIEEVDENTGEDHLPPGTTATTTAKRHKAPKSDEDDTDDAGDDDEIIDVIDDTDSELEEDPLLALKGALQRLKGAQAGGHLPSIPNRIDESDEEDDVEDGEDGEDESEDLPPLHVTEYVRRGARIAEERIVVESLSALLDNSAFTPNSGSSTTGPPPPSLPNPGRGLPVPRTSETLPIQLQDERSRLAVLLTACASNIQSVIELDRKWIGPVIVVRWLIHFSGNKEKQKESEGTAASPMQRKWSKGEVKALLLAFGVGDHGPRDNEAEWMGSDQASTFELAERSIQLIARALSVLEAMRMLVQSLGLAHRVPLQITKFKGRVFHERCRTIVAPLESDVQLDLVAVDERVWAAVSDRLESFIGEDPTKRIKKKKEPTPKSQATAASAKKSVVKGPLFSVLAGMENVI
ncbi:hypothetical protein FRC19_006945 [Serendipita sp. 401]|nr:hypothetical protein FRC19_006945 [Serendipita sp. 401]